MKTVAGLPFGNSLSFYFVPAVPYSRFTDPYLAFGFARGVGQSLARPQRGASQLKRADGCDECVAVFLLRIHHRLINILAEISVAARSGIRPDKQHAHANANQTSSRKIQDSRVKLSSFKSQESRFKSQDSRFKTRWNVKSTSSARRTGPLPSHVQKVSVGRLR